MSDLKPAWRRVKFGEVVRLVTERCDPLAARLERVVGLEHLEPGESRIRSWSNVSEGTTFTTRFRPGQVLFGKRRAYQRKVAVADFEGVCSGDIYVFESADPNRLLPELLPFICQTGTFFEHAVGTSAGSLSPRTNWTSLASYEFALPPLEEQKKLARALEAAQFARAATEAAAVQARTTGTSYVEEALASLRDTCDEVLAPEVLDRLTVGIVVKPADWYTTASTGVPALRSLNIRPGGILLEDVVRITSEGHAIHEKSQVRAGDVVVVRTGRPGEAAVIPAGAGPMNCIDLIVTTPNAKLHPDFFCLILNSAFGKRQFLAGATGTAQQHFNVGAFKRLRLPLPPRDVQASVVENFRTLETAAQRLDDRAGQCKRIGHSLLRGLEA